MSLHTIVAETGSTDFASPLSELSNVKSVMDPTMDLYEGGYHDPVYEAKARILNRAMQDIGMGRYQWYLFFVAGFGWFVDITWITMIGLILVPVVNEFHFNGPFLPLAFNIGLFFGAFFWGFACDIWGRRWPFNMTFFIAGVVGLAAGGAPSFVGLSSFVAVLASSVAGNLPIDNALFLDFLPASHQYLLSTLSSWWGLGHLMTSLIAWALIGNYSCENAIDCSKAKNMGWRYLSFTLGGFTLVLATIRVFVFKMLESPRFLAGDGRDADAVKIIHELAKFNGKTSSLTVEELEAPNRASAFSSSKEKHRILSKSSKISTKHIKALFATPKMVWSTSLLISIWGILGLALALYNNFLPYLLYSRGAAFGDASLYTTYRNLVILSVICVPAGPLSGRAVEITFLGRKGTLAIATGESRDAYEALTSLNDHSRNTGLTGTFLFATTTARTSNQLLGWNCAYSFCNNILFGVLTSITVEVFPAKDRGTGAAVMNTSTRLFGILGPVIALYANLATSVPVYIAGALITFSAGLALLLPYEPRGKASI